MKKKVIILLAMVMTVSLSLFADDDNSNRIPTLQGIVYDETNTPMIAATVYIDGTTNGTITNDKGRFFFKNLPGGKYRVSVSFIGYKTMSREVDYNGDRTMSLTFNMFPDDNQLLEIEVFGERYKQPSKLEAITRMPLRPNEQIQTISVISDKSIVEQGALTVTDATKNVPGVSLFGSYGGVRESMSIRGYRGVPILKNGVRIDSDFRTGSALSDMQGVENIQVIKGSSAITQGIGNDVGSAGGVINVVTKTPKFENSGNVSLRMGSWGELRPSFDIQTILDKEHKVAFRLNGAYQRKDNYRPFIGNDRIYVNPSVEWRPSENTTVTMEMDYLNDNQTPYTSSVNLSDDTQENLYDMPYDKFLGFAGDNVNNKTLTYSVRFAHKLNDNYSIRASYLGADYKVDNTSTSVNSVVKKQYNMRRRTVSRSLREDRNSTLQLDFVGRDVFTGPLKHTFQLGFDYKTNNLSTTSYGSAIIDTIDVLAPAINNVLPAGIVFAPGTPVKSSSSTYGLMAQEVMTISKYLKAIMGLRYSSINSIDDTSVAPVCGDAWNPMVGIMVTPLRNINLFGSYTTTTSLRGATNKMSDGTEIGASDTRQYEAGIKSEWLNNRLRFNVTYFNIMQRNLSYATYDQETFQLTGYYDKAGDLKRSGVEAEISGHITDNLQLILGYSYIDARYTNSPAYHEGSAPMNTPMNMSNGWIQYNFSRGLFKGLSAAAGIYYTGKRPVNDWTLKMDGHGSMIGAKPFDMPAYTTMNAQLAYGIGKITARIYLNNIFDSLGYNSYYRGGYINQIDPRNVSGVITYSF